MRFIERSHWIIAFYIYSSHLMQYSIGSGYSFLSSVALSPVALFVRRSLIRHSLHPLLSHPSLLVVFLHSQCLSIASRLSTSLLQSVSYFCFWKLPSDSPLLSLQLFLAYSFKSNFSIITKQPKHYSKIK